LITILVFEIILISLKENKKQLICLSIDVLDTTIYIFDIAVLTLIIKSELLQSRLLHRNMIYNQRIKGEKDETYLFMYFGLFVDYHSCDS